MAALDGRVIPAGSEFSRRVHCVRRGLISFSILMALLVAVPARADSDLSVIRDAEIEAYLREITTPIFDAAGLGDQHVTIVIIDSPELNAFVAGGQNIFITTALLAATDDAPQLYGVVAHETGHIAGGHLIRGAAVGRQASAQAIMATVLGVAAGVASGNAGAAGAMIMGGTDMATRSFLAYSREQESSADNAGLTFMERAKLDPRGLPGFLEKLEGQELLPPERQSVFVRNHPLTRDRVEATRARVTAEVPNPPPVPADWVEKHQRMQAKLMGFTDPFGALQKYPASDKSFAGQYARGIALWKRNQLNAGLPIMDALIAREPKNPWVHETKGQMLFESSQVAASIPEYTKALDLAPRTPLLQTELAHALIENAPEGNSPVLAQVVPLLQDSLAAEPDNATGWRLLATAWGRQGKEGLSSYALAESAAASGDIKLARLQAAKAEHMLPAGSPELLKLNDLKEDLQRLEDLKKENG